MGPTTMATAASRLRSFGEDLHWRSFHVTRRLIPAMLLVALLSVPLQCAFGRQAGLWAALPGFWMLCGFIVACGVAGAGRAAVAATDPASRFRRAAIAAGWAVMALVTCAVGAAGFWAFTVLVLNGGAPE
jgi:hypothetical protein